MNLLPRQYIQNNELPSTALLIPYKQETIQAVVHFNKAQKISILEDQFLAYIGIYQNQSILIINTGIGFETLLLVAFELYKKQVKNFYLISPVFPMKKKDTKDTTILSKSTLLYSTKDKLTLLNKNLPESSKFQQSLTISLDHIFLNEKIVASKYDTCSIISYYDYYFFSFLNKYKLNGFSINYLPDKSNENEELTEMVNYNNAINFCLKYLFEKRNK